MENKKKLAEFYLLKANALVATKNYEEAILYYKYGETLAEEMVSKEYTIQNCKLVASYLFFEAVYLEEMGEYARANMKFQMIPRYISEWSNQFSDCEVSKLLASAYGKLAEYYFYKQSNYGTEYLVVDALAKGTYSVELFLSIIKKELSAGLCYGLLQSNITLGVLFWVKKERQNGENCFAEAKKALKKCMMLNRLSGEEDESLLEKRRLIYTLEQRFETDFVGKEEKLFLMFHNYLYGKNTKQHKNCIL